MGLRNDGYIRRTRLGDELRLIAEERPGVSWNQLAAEADISPNTMNQWVRGFRRRPLLAVLRRAEEGLKLERGRLVRAAGYAVGTGGDGPDGPDMDPLEAAITTLFLQEQETRERRKALIRMRQRRGRGGGTRGDPITVG